jgi:hypothetical protein
MPPATMEEYAVEAEMAITVVGKGRVDLGAHRKDDAIMEDIREIGGEQYLWEFAQFTKGALERQRMPPPPTISY